jgi:DNA-binding phage protein
MVGCAARNSAHLNNMTVSRQPIYVVDSPTQHENAVRKTARTDLRNLVAAQARLAMHERGFTSIRALADASGLGTGTVADILRGKSDPRLSTMLALVRALELASIEELLSPLGTTLLLGSLSKRVGKSESN